MKRDLGNNKIIDIEDNAINGAGGSTKPERVVFVLLENEHCSTKDAHTKTQQPEDACSLATKVNAPHFDSPCYNGGSCVNGTPAARTAGSGSNYSCLCPPGYAGSLCETNIDDCVEHQCQNGAMCVDGINSYRCVCRDPTTSGEFCEQLSSFSSSSANSIAPVALPMISLNSGDQPTHQPQSQPLLSFQTSLPQQQAILPRSADFSHRPIELASPCKRVTQRKYYEDGNGCQSVRVLKISECAGTCTNCCLPVKVKRRRVRMQCSDGASYVKTIELVKKCACSSECPSFSNRNQDQQQNALTSGFNYTREDQPFQITRLDAEE